jgi:hypothetical protein
MQLSDDFMRFPDRRSWYIFLARMAVLLVAAGALLTYGLLQALPRTTEPSTPAPAARPTLTPGPELSASLSAAPDATGALTEDVQVVSDDGLAVLELPKGTRVLDAQGQPLASVTVTSVDLPPASDTYALVGKGYKFGPEGATLDPPASLTISYDTLAVFPFGYQDVIKDKVYLAYWENNGPRRPPLASEKWVPLGEPPTAGLGVSVGQLILGYLGTVDSQTASVSAKIDHLGTFVLYCAVAYYPMS